VVHDETGKRKRTKNDPSKVVELPDVTPAIVSEEIWTRANSNRIQRVARDETRNEAKPVMLRGLVFCLRCGKKRYIVSNGQTTDIFRCGSKTSDSLIPNCGSRSIAVTWLTKRTWEKMREIMRTKENLLRIIDDMKKDGNQVEPLVKDQGRLEKRIEDIEKRTGRLLKLVSGTDDEMVSEIYEKEIKSLAEERRSIETVLLEVRLMISEAERSLPNIPVLIELHNQFAWGAENWSDDQRRDYLLSGGFRIYSDGKRFEIRLHTGKVVAEFDESSARLVAYE
jgi:hypothetical protein